MYEGHFNLRIDPFRLLPDPGICFPHRSCARAWSYLRYAVKRSEGIVVVIGPPGSGKTTLADRFLKELNPSETVSARLIAHDLSPTDLLRKLAYAFGLPAEGIDRAMLAHSLEHYLFGLEQTNRRALVVIDEAQTLSNPALEAMRLLTDLQSRSRPVLQLILMGQNELEGAMSAPGMEQFQQRVIASCRLQPMDLTETKAYLEYRLDRADWHGDPAFDGPAVMAIFRHSRGLPRHVNKICSRLMLRASSERKHALTEPDVEAVVHDLREELIAPANRGRLVDQPAGVCTSVYELALVPNGRPAPSGWRAVRSLAGLYPKDEVSKIGSRPHSVAPSWPSIAEGDSPVEIGPVGQVPPPHDAPELPARPQPWSVGTLLTAIIGLRDRLGPVCADSVDRLLLYCKRRLTVALGGLAAVVLVVVMWQVTTGNDEGDATMVAASAVSDSTDAADFYGSYAVNPVRPGFEASLVANSAAEPAVGPVSGTLNLPGDTVDGAVADQLTGVHEEPARKLIAGVGEDDAVSFVGSGIKESADDINGPELGLPNSSTEDESNARPEVPGRVSSRVAAATSLEQDGLAMADVQSAGYSMDPQAPATGFAVRPASAADTASVLVGQANNGVAWTADSEIVLADLDGNSQAIVTVERDGLEQSASMEPLSLGLESATSLALHSAREATDQARRDVLVLVEVERLAELAEKAMARYRFLLPQNDSAYTYYRRILDLDPENAHATNGLERIVDKYREISSKALGEDDFKKAHLYVERALRVDPKDVDARRLRRSIDRAVADAMSARQAATELAAIKREAQRLSQLRQQAPPRPKQEPSSLERLMDFVD